MKAEAAARTCLPGARPSPSAATKSGKSAANKLNEWGAIPVERDSVAPKHLPRPPPFDVEC
jgi:hypothetical protein